MTHEEVMQMLAELKIPFAYDHFAEGESPDPPFICFLFPGSENFAADDVVYMEFSNLSIELYTSDLFQKISCEFSTASTLSSNFGSFSSVSRTMLR